MIKEQLAQELLTIVQSTKEGVIKGLDFAMEETPILISEIIKFNIVINIFYVTIGILFALIALVFLKKVNNLFKKHWKLEAENKERYYSWPDSEVALCILSIALTIIPSIVSITSLTKFIPLFKVWLAPRLFLIEYLGSLVKAS